MKWFKRNKSKSEDKMDFVNVFDLHTQSVTKMPACELAEHMIEAQIDGVEGNVWVDARELQQSDYRHPPFTEEIRDLLREIKSSIDEFYCLPVEEWEDGFRRDTNPDKEIAYWLHLGDVYRGMCIGG